MAADNGRTGRRPGSNPTKQEILDAARETFAVKGFRGATIRAIAEAAVVDPGLVHHYFRTKQELLAACVQFPIDAAPEILEILKGDPERLGEQLSRAYLSLWEEPRTRRQMEIITKLALTDTEVMAHVRPAIMEVLSSVTASLTGPDPGVRFQLAMGHLLGIAILRHLTQAAPLSELPFNDLVARVEPAVHSYLTDRTTSRIESGQASDPGGGTSPAATVGLPRRPERRRSAPERPASSERSRKHPR